MLFPVESPIPLAMLFGYFLGYQTFLKALNDVFSLFPGLIQEATPKFSFPATCGGKKLQIYALNNEYDALKNVKENFHEKVQAFSVGANKLHR